MSKSGFYEFSGRQPSPRQREDDRIASVIGALRVEEGAFFNTYGSPRMRAELMMAHGFRIGRKRVERIMREHGWTGSMKRKKKWGKANAATAEDRVNRNFTAARPNQLWFTDITEHHTSQGKVYCAVVLDAFSRRAIGWSISSRMTADLVVDALQMANWRRLGVRGAIMHSDHGSRIHLLGFHLPRPRSRTPGVDGNHRRLLRQRDDGIVLVGHATRTPRHPNLVDTAATRDRDVLPDRGLVQPETTPLRPRLPLASRIREDQPVSPRNRGLTTTSTRPENRGKIRPDR